MAEIHTSRLCTEIIHTHFGPLTAKMTSTLLTRGRLSFPQLCRYSQLKPRVVRLSILALTQHNVLWHTKGSDDVEMFEVNIDECLMRLRFGRFIWSAECILGPLAANIVQTVLDHGKLRMADIHPYVRAYDVQRINDCNAIFHKLVAGSFLKPSTLLSHLSPRDKFMKYEKEEKRKINGFPTAKQLRHAKEVAESRLRMEEESEASLGLKHKVQEHVPGRLGKRKANQLEEVVDDAIYFRVNYEKFNILIWNTVIEKAAKERFNVGASLVLRAVIKATDNQRLKLSDPRTGAVAVSNIISELPENSELVDGLAYSIKKVSIQTSVKDYLGMLSYADNPTSEGRRAAFLSFSASKVRIEFEVIAKRLRIRLVEAFAQDKHGIEGLRIIRLLLDKGKLDEKQISKTVMMAPKDVRPLLVALAEDSLISTQEVPKSADRNPTRTFYLWFVDLRKAFSVILGNTYKILYNVMGRRREESENADVAAVLEKRQRSDVSQDENLLTRLEREILRTWEAKEEKLAMVELRVEEVIFIIKDLATLCNVDD